MTAIHAPGPASTAPVEFDVFISAPMAAFRSAEKYRAFRNDTMAVVRGLEECGLTVFFAGREVESPDAFDEPDESAVRDLAALDRSRYFLLIYPERVVSSVLVEAGYALARGMKAVYFVRDVKHLPFLLRHLDRIQPIKVYEYESTDRILTLIRRHQARLFEPWREPPTPSLPTTTTAGPVPLVVGASVGPYTLVAELGQGGFGTVWRAERRTALATTSFALKFPHARGSENALVETVRREATAWACASGHPNVLPVIEAECYDGRLVIVTPFAAEGGLDRWLRRNGGAAPTVAAAVEMAAGIVAGLAHLHGLRLVHRDLKPANVLLEAGGPRIADFGLARVLSMDQTQTVGGTPAYMAPEAWNGEQSEAADQWAVGVMLYEMLAGHRPFPQLNLDALRRAVANDEPPPLPPVVPEALAAITNRILRKRPQDRYSSAQVLLAELGTLRIPRAAVSNARATFDEVVGRWVRLSATVAVELARADQQSRWAAGELVPAEEYLVRLPQIAACPNDALVLVYGEVLLRAERGESVDRAAMVARFPQYRDALGPLFEVHSVLNRMGIADKS